MKITFSIGVACMASMVFATAPEITLLSTGQESTSRAVIVTYSLANEPAVVTFAAQTNNGSAWIDIGNENLNSFEGDVNRLVAVGNDHRVVWHPDKSWPDHKINDGTFRVGLKAWATNAPPNYMVIDLGQTGHVRYYDAEDEASLPFSVTDDRYKTDYLVMRKIHGQGVEWRMGSPVGEDGREADKEAAHAVTFTKDYYIGVFTVTQRQYARMTSSAGPDSAMWKLPQNNTSYNAFQTSIVSFNTANGTLLRSPTEAEWEFACRAGTGTAYNNGTDDASRIGEIAWYKGNSDNTVHEVGLKLPNAWGIYDMHGNVWEVCSDLYADDYGCGNAAVTDPTGGSSGSPLVWKGGYYTYDANKMRSARRFPGASATGSAVSFSFRLAADAIATR